MCKISKKNIFASLLAVSMIFTMMSTTVVHAQSVKDGSNEVTVTPNVGVSYVSPEETIETEVHQDLVRYGTSRVKGNTILLVPLIIKTCILIISLQEKRVIRFM